MSFFAANRFFGKSKGYVPRAVRATHHTPGSPIATTSSVANHDDELQAHLEDRDPEFVEQVQELLHAFGSVAEADSSDEEDNPELIEGETPQPDSDSEDQDDLFPPDLPDLPVDVEWRKEDIAHNKKLDKFINEGCGCKKTIQKGKSCSSVLYDEVWDLVLQTREDMAEASSAEKDLVIKSALLPFRRNGKMTTNNKRKATERKRVYQNYYFAGYKICRAAFAFIYDTCIKTVQEIGRDLDKNGMRARVHGLRGKPRANALTAKQTEDIARFLLRYGEDKAYPLPGRMPNQSDFSVMLLPSEITKRRVHTDYQSFASSMNIRQVCYSTFRNVWKLYCPLLCSMKPGTDLCDQCQKFMLQLMRSANRPEAEKKEDMIKQEKHLAKATGQRGFLKEKCEEAKDPNNEYELIHIDYGQRYHLPHYPQQPGPIYFLSPYKVDICCLVRECNNIAQMYLLPEGSMPGKGANTTISILHYALETGYRGKPEVDICCDNCGGQTYNNIVVKYLLWRVMTGRQSKMMLFTLVVGHTKFPPDLHLGLNKLEWNRTTVEFMNELKQCILNSCKVNIPVDVEELTFYDWKEFLNRPFKNITDFKQYHHFMVEACKPGVVTVQEFFDSKPQPITILKKGVRFDPNKMPRVITGPGIDAARQWYLYDKVRDQMVTEEAKDLLCPLPTVPRPAASGETESDDDSSQLPEAEVPEASGPPGVPDLPVADVASLTTDTAHTSDVPHASDAPCASNAPLPSDIPHASTASQAAAQALNPTVPRNKNKVRNQRKKAPKRKVSVDEAADPGKEERRSDASSQSQVPRELESTRSGRKRRSVNLYGEWDV